MTIMWLNCYVILDSQFQYKPPQQRPISDSPDPSVAVSTSLNYYRLIKITWKGPSRYDKGNGQSFVPRQKRRRQQDSDESEDEGDMNKGRGQRSAFVTAKDQYVSSECLKYLTLCFR